MSKYNSLKIVHISLLKIFYRNFVAVYFNLYCRVKKLTFNCWGSGEMLFKHQTSLNSKTFLCLNMWLDMLTYNKFIFSYPYSIIETVLFLGQIYEIEIFMALRFLRSPESGKHIFNDLCMCCLFVISKTPKHIVAKAPNSIFYT